MPRNADAKRPLLRSSMIVNSTILAIPKLPLGLVLHVIIKLSLHSYPEEFGHVSGCFRYLLLEVEMIFPIILAPCKVSARRSCGQVAADGAPWRAAGVAVWGVSGGRKLPKTHSKQSECTESCIL